MSSLRECVAHVLGAEAADVPDEEPALRDWLAQRGLGLVPIADPAAFSWPAIACARSTLRSGASAAGASTMATTVPEATAPRAAARTSWPAIT